MMSKISLIRQVQLKKGSLGCITPQQVNWRLLIATHLCCILSWFREILHHLLLIFNETYPGAPAYFFTCLTPGNFTRQ